MKLQEYRRSDDKILQSQIRLSAKTRLIFNGLAVVHGRLKEVNSNGPDSAWQMLPTLNSNLSLVAPGLRRCSSSKKCCLVSLYRSEQESDKCNTLPPQKAPFQIVHYARRCLGNGIAGPGEEMVFEPKR